MSAWKLVEAIEEVRPSEISSNFGERRGGKGGRGGRGGVSGGGRRPSFGARNGPNRGGVYNYRGNRSEEITDEIDPQTREYYAHMAIQQIELLYGTDYLCVDTYFRSYMDVQGYVPMALLISFPNISCYASTVEDLITKLSQKDDTILEVNIANLTVRLKEGWDKWLMPNSSGTKGVPKYERQQEGVDHMLKGSYFNGGWCEDEDQETPGEISVDIHKRDSPILGLSASAMEFKPKMAVVASVSASGKVSYAAAASKTHTP